MHVFVSAPYHYKHLLLIVRLLCPLMHIKIGPCCLEGYYWI